MFVIPALRETLSLTSLGSLVVIVSKEQSRGLSVNRLPLVCKFEHLVFHWGAV